MTEAEAQWRLYHEDDDLTLWLGDCRHVLATLPDASVDAVCTDAPYELAFMGRTWDQTGVAYDVEMWRQVLRVLKPGGHLLAFGGTRTWHRLTCAIEDAGFEIRDSIAWLYASGFPKSLDVSKAIDKAAGADREVVGTKLGQPGYSLTDGNGDHRTYGRGLGNTGSGEAECAVTAPATDDAARWQGWGTALKPGHEPIVVARKPLSGTVAQNVLAYGTGALNIDATRVASDEPSSTIARRQYAPSGAKGALAADSESRGELRDRTSPERFAEQRAGELIGRWPPNVVLDGEMAAALDQQTGDLRARGNVAPTNGGGGMYGHAVTTVDHGAGDSGGASRFFPTFRYEAKAPSAERPRDDGGNSHPTVKPLDLIRWLVRLVTPPGGIVLDPFAGSGTTAEACIVEGMRCWTIEKDEGSAKLVVKRLSKPIGVVLF